MALDCWEWCFCSEARTWCDPGSVTQRSEYVWSRSNLYSCWPLYVMVSKCDILLYQMLSSSSACDTSPMSSITRNFHWSGGPSGSPFAFGHFVSCNTGSGTFTGSFGVQGTADLTVSCVCQLSVELRGGGDFPLVLLSVMKVWLVSWGRLQTHCSCLIVQMPPM